jgi:hypothetical protein
MVKWENMEPANTLTMILAAAVTTAEACLKPVMTASCADSPRMGGQYSVVLVRLKCARSGRGVDLR